MSVLVIFKPILGHIDSVKLTSLLDKTQFLINRFWQRTTCKTTVKIQSFKFFGMFPKFLFSCTRDVHAMSVLCFDKVLGAARTQKLVKFLLNWFSLFLLIFRCFPWFSFKNKKKIRKTATSFSWLTPKFWSTPWGGTKVL